MLILLPACLLPIVATADRKAPFSLSLGTQSIGVRYQFSDEPAVVESARQIAALGSDTLKIALTPNYVTDYLLEEDPSITSILDLLERYPSYLEAMDMPFRNLMLWAYPFSDRMSAFEKGHIPKAEADAIYRELYELTAFLLKRYSGTGKSIFLGNWEGDWHVMLENYDYGLDPDPRSIQGAIQWFSLREKAVSDARRDVPHTDVEVYFYVELNHVGKSMDYERPSIVNRVLPHIRTDFVSWSSYDVTKPAAVLGGDEGRERVHAALDYIESHLPDSDISGKRVFVGEYGFEASSFGTPERQAKLTAHTAMWALEWGCPFVLYWELYCNEIEPKTGKHRGYWLIDDEGEKQPAWYLHKHFLEKANAFVEDYRKKHGNLPSQETYNAEVVSWLK